MTISAGTVLCPANCGTLGSQACNVGCNQITLSKAITCNNGNLGGACETVTYVGRMVMVRQGLSNEEERYITSIASGNRVNVHEDWCCQPAACDTFDVSYIPRDMMCDGATRLCGKADWYKMCSQLTIGNSMAFTYYFHGDGIFMDHTKQCSTARGAAAINVTTCGRMNVGYQASNKPTSGGVWRVPTCTVRGATYLTICSGGETQYNDLVMFSSAPMTFEDDGVGQWCRVKITNIASCMALSVSATTYKNVIFEGVNDACDVIDLGACVKLVCSTLSRTGGFISTTGATETIDVGNLIFLPNNTQFLEVRGNKTWNINNPVWNPNTGDQTHINFTSSTGNVVYENFEIHHTVADTSAVAIACAPHWITEVNPCPAAPTANRVFSNACGKIDTLVRKRQFNCNTGCTLTIITHSDFATKIYKYGKSPFISGQAMTVETTLTPTLICDTNIVEATQATAITNGAGITVTKDVGTPFAIINFTGGSGTMVDGDTVTGLTGSVTSIFRELVSGILAGTGAILVENVSGTYTNAETLDATTGTWQATSDQTANPQQEFSWGINANAKTLSVTYDYLAARQSQKDACTISPFVCVQIWGEDENGYIFQAEGGCSYKTERTIRLTEGVVLWNYGSGSISKFTADDGTTFIPPATVQVNMHAERADTGANIAGVSVIIIDTAGPTTLFNGTTDASGDFNNNFVYTSDVTVEIRFRKSTLPIPRFFTEKRTGTITSTGLSVDVLMREDSIVEQS